MKARQKSGVNQRQRVEGQVPELRPIHPNAAGIDIGSQTHWVSVPANRASEPVRSFGCYTAER